MSLQFKVFLLLLSLIVASTYVYKTIQTNESRHKMMSGTKLALELDVLRWFLSDEST